MSDENKPALFADNSQALMQRDAAAVARATQEIQAALVIAQRFPRDEVRVKSKILEACKRKELAEVAEYEYSRGGTRITGPTVDLLRAIANRWGNIRFGWSETERRDGQSTVRCFAWDTQTNGQAERSFVVRHWRDTQGGGYELTDERDIYELLANSAARRVRACMEEVIDSDIITAAIDQCRLTLRSGEKTPLSDRAVQMVATFAEFGVTQAMIEKRLGNKLEAVSENQLASLRRVWKSLRDGVGKREEYFKPETVAPDFTGTAPAAAAGKPATNPDEAAEAAAGLAPAQPATTPPATTPPPQPAAEDKATFNTLRALRGLCKMAEIPEGLLLGHLAERGATDGSPATLEELVMSHAAVARMACDQWPTVSAEIKAKKGKA